MQKHSLALNNVHVVVGFDVHKDFISACVYDGSRELVLLEQKFRKEPTAIRKLIRRVRERFGEPGCYHEASSCGFILFRLLSELGVHCEVIAPSSIPRRSGDRVKNDRIVAHKLATLYAAGLLQGVDVPDEELEATCAAALPCGTGRGTWAYQEAHDAVATNRWPRLPRWIELVPEVLGMSRPHPPRGNRPCYTT